MGKSTTAAGVFYYLKRAGVNCELVTEYAKDIVWDGSPLLKNQLHILAEQERRFRRLRGKVDLVVTDAPILQGLAYVPSAFDKPWFHEAVLQLSAEYDNRNYRLSRGNWAYQGTGRHVDEQGARRYDDVIATLCQRYVPDAITIYHDPVETLLKAEGFN